MLNKIKIQIYFLMSNDHHGKIKAILIIGEKILLELLICIKYYTVVNRI